MSVGQVKDNSYNNVMGSASSMFMLPMYFGILFTILCIGIVIIFSISNIKDDQRFGIKVSIPFLYKKYLKYKNI